MANSSSQGFDPTVAREWLQRLSKWDPALHAAASQRLKALPELPGGAQNGALEAQGDFISSLETIVRRSRPVLSIRDNRITAVGAAIDEDPESRLVVEALQHAAPRIEPLIPLVGRIDVVNDPGGRPFLGTGWMVDADVVITNRHVAELIGQWNGARFVFRVGRFGEPLSASLDFKHEMEGSERQVVEIADVIWIEPKPNGPDVAFLRLKRPRDGTRVNRIEIADADAAPGTRAAVIGYPARAPAHIVPDQTRMDQLYRSIYDVKRIAPGLVTTPSRGAATHDCTTLGGNSGSVVLDTSSGKALGLHFAGVYLLENYAVPASVIREYLRTRPWQGGVEQARPPAPQSTPAPQPPASAVPAIHSPSPPPAPANLANHGSGAVSITIPLIVTVALGQPALGSPTATVQSATVGQSGAIGGWPAATDLRSAARSFAAANRAQGVLSVTPGRRIEHGRNTGEACLRAIVAPDRLTATAGLIPAYFQGLPVQLRAASLHELMELDPDNLATEAVTSISYNDADRQGPEFSFEAIEAEMQILCHVGPERSWSVLSGFLAAAGRELVSSIYEFHARHIAEALALRLEDNVHLDLVLATQSRDPRTGPTQDATSFPRAETFANWDTKFGNRFDHIYVPLGPSGLVANAYHIKVTVRDESTTWLSSGNWKVSSQPPIKRADLDNPVRTDAAGNREWHVVIDNKEIARRYRAHIREDLAHSKRLGGQREAVAGGDSFVDVPETLEAAVLEAAPARVLEPKLVSGRIRVQPLLTPDRQGAVYSEAVLALIRSARRELLFQIPYITLTNASPEFLRQLVEALVEKSKSIADVRVILRSDHGSWKPGALALHDAGMDIEQKVRHLPRTHTKGMVVDAERVLLGSHNWSGPGVTLNRDASLIFDGNREIADYYRTAFELDWNRATRATLADASRGAREEESVRIAEPGTSTAAGYRRMRLADYLEL